ncbi:DUF547 domain-containing protein [Emticicia agri]|uniref:DUF547 domain-containing protein n=1 Tax=Emticicia agri TaxID=2492393 RepID=A0A4V1ZCP1_9BACT|nr:DUF547 domain-containing protein [Emticicia agri]RYU93340.1 DUF547 domain-containing protein [Emticicia agri]
MKKKSLVIIFQFLIFQLYAQQAYKVGDIVKNIPITRVLNTDKKGFSLNEFKKEITIIDFFGTWCAPCIKALPHLAQLQTTFKDNLNIILVSNEEEAKLTKFIEARKPFMFPVVIDKENTFNNLFKPASFPYTVILDKSGTIIAIMDAASLNEKIINDWLSGKKIKSSMSSSVVSPISRMSNNLKSSNKFVQLSQTFVYSAKTGENTDKLLQELKTLNYHELVKRLVTDDEKKAFWINAYNGFTQVILKKDPDKYKDRSAFFEAKQIWIAGQLFSLDQIEHDILRHSKPKWSLGYFSRWFPDKREEDLRVEKVDYRIHFALNCGAKSCPPIAFYNPENLNAQLDLATDAYLKSEVSYDAKNNIVHLPAIMSWFRGDFGGKTEMIELLKAKKIIPEKVNPSIEFKKYDWELYLDNYKL